MVSKTLLCAVLLAAAVAAVSADGYQYNVTNGAFHIEDVHLSTVDGHFRAGSKATVQVTGTIDASANILAGDVKFQVWESGIVQFVASGFSPYFVCTNKGCDTSEPVALRMTENRFELVFDFTMPAQERPAGTPEFKLVFWGTDQHHYPYDFSATIRYLLEPTAADFAALPAPEHDAYQYNVTNGAFHIDDVKMSTADDKWTAGATATVTVTGMIDPSANILAGDVKFQVWESGIVQFVASGFSPYFVCTNKGCDTSDPVALTMEASGAFSLTFDFTMPHVERPAGTTEFKLVFWGTDQNHYPYDFSATIRYMLEVSAEEEQAAAAAALSTGFVSVESPEHDAYQYNVTNGAFHISQVEMDTETGEWMAGETATVTVTGMIDPSANILAGDVKFQVWESGIVQFVASGFSPYFVCTNKGCDTSDPVALRMTADGAFTLTFDFTMPHAQRPAGTSEFKLVFWGTDQHHYPYDFSATVRYLIRDDATTNFAPIVPAAATNALRGAVTQAPISFNKTNGAFIIHDVSMASSNGQWTIGETATVTLTGVIPSKYILAGTVKYKIYEFGVRYFVTEGNSQYFRCNNKGCHTDEPIALHLTNPNSVPTDFTLSFSFPIPAKAAGAVGNSYKLVLWGQDQDHYPYDFSATIRFDVS